MNTDNKRLKRKERANKSRSQKEKYRQTARTQKRKKTEEAEKDAPICYIFLITWYQSDAAKNIHFKRYDSCLSIERVTFVQQLMILKIEKLLFSPD